MAFVTKNERFCDLASWEHLFAVCADCGHSRQIDRHALQRKYGLTTKINSLRPLLSCDPCEEKTLSVFGKANAPRD